MDTTQNTRLSLILRVRENDANAQGEFVGLYAAKIKKWIEIQNLKQPVPLNQTELADAVQDAYTRLFSAIQRNVFSTQNYGGPKHFRKYLMTIIKSACIDVYRDKIRHEKNRVAISDESELSSNIEKHFDSLIEKETLHFTIDQLKSTLTGKKKTYVEVFEASKIHEKETDTVATEFSITPEDVHRYNYRAMRILKETMNSESNRGG